MNESKATRYQRLRRRARAASIGSAALMLAIIALTPVSRWLRDLAQGFAGGLSGGAAATVALVLFVVLVVVLWELASLPAAIYLARRVDSPFGQSAPSVEEVLAEQAHATVVALPAGLAASAAVVVAFELAGRWWWVIAGPMLAVLLAVALQVAPFVFARLGRVRPLDRPSLTARLSMLARQARVPVAGIEEWVVDESSPATALVTGVGPARRILLSPEIARRWTDDEVVVVVAHELAHHFYRDLWRTFAVHVAVLWVSLFAADLVVVRVSSGSGAGDLAALPLVALVACGVWLLATPLRNAQSRRHERRADRFALTMTGGVEAFGAAVTRLGARHLAEERPSALTRWLYHSHPSVAERLAWAEAFQKAVPGDVVPDWRRRPSGRRNAGPT
jgi:STE24 endopeptidase